MLTKFNQFQIKATYKGNKSWDAMPENYNNHIVTVTNTENKQRTSFEFWQSISKPEMETEHDLLFAFQCFVDDAIAGKDSFTSFCSEFGYNEDSRKAYKTYKACQHSAEKLERIYNGDIYDLGNKIQELEL